MAEAEDWERALLEQENDELRAEARRLGLEVSAFLTREAVLAAREESHRRRVEALEGMLRDAVEELKGG